MNALAVRRLFRVPPWLGALLFSWLAAAAFAQDAADPPARVAYVSERQGSVVFAPQGEEEWTELPQNRPLVEGDRLWTDQGARAELQLGTATVHVSGETHLGISNLDERAAQFMIQQGTLNLRVREVAGGENVELDTPNVAVRALQPGDIRVDVDTQSQQTRVVVTRGVAAVFGEGGESIHLGAGQQASFAGRYLAQVTALPYRQDDFALWADERNRAEDQAVASRYVPRGVVGAPQLDPYGTWTQDPNYGTVWYPTVTVANWAPYRYGHWSWIAPWGWTWIDDAPWGFAPFHYGRWTMIGTRWAWVPGQLATRPVYAPALVVFLGGGGSQFAFNSGPAVGWYPLAPGEAWWPWYRTSPRYVSYANYRINLNAWPRGATNHLWRQRTFAVTAVREEDFRRGRPVERSWQPVQPHMIDRAQVNIVPARPQRGAGDHVELAPRLRNAPPTAMPAWNARWSHQPAPGEAAVRGQAQVPPLVREQTQAQREQDRLQWQAQREARIQMLQQQEERANARGNAGRVDAGTPQRDAGRVEPGGNRRHEPARVYQQALPPSVPVPRQQFVPIVRGEQRPAPAPAQPVARAEGHAHAPHAPAPQPDAAQQVQGGWQHQAGEERRGHWNR